MSFLLPWIADANPLLATELARELPSSHVLHGVPVSVIARRQDADDVLFALNDGTGRVAVVHLTWSVEKDPSLPETIVFSSLESWYEAMRAEHGDEREDRRSSED